MQTRRLASALLLAGHVTTTSADVPSAQRHEVEHLLNFIANTTCIITRNGSLHNGPEALSHIKRKYAYYREAITSTEEFIERSASKSTLSGEAYTVRCADRAVIATREWLLYELGEYRDKGTDKSSTVNVQ
ncbi:MAG: DUF5329 family protein [Thiotrichaceae bacterium]|nr:DUF5329 family protein [Thiotrichaceae bacterium]PCI12564.1 MAG: hypothetical protein COB71_08630 [Thiotrichales bacterium]